VSAFTRDKPLKNPTTVASILRLSFCANKWVEHIANNEIKKIPFIKCFIQILAKN
jgi:hypothetical protein